MTTPSEILDEAGDETVACPACGGDGREYVNEPLGRGVRGNITCENCHGSTRVPKPKADQPSAEVIERVAGVRVIANYALAPSSEDILGSDAELGASVRRMLDRSVTATVTAQLILGEPIVPTEDAHEDLARARAALSAIPQPAEVVGPAWRDKPDAEGWWLSQPATGPCVWFQAADEAHGIIYTPEELARLPFVARWFGPVRIPEDKVGA
jgi:hypothetical protein